MATSCNLTPTPLIPVIIFDKQADLSEIMYLETQLGQSPGRSGEHMMHEIRKHLPDTKFARFAKRCVFKHQIVSIASLIDTSRGPEMTTPVQDTLLTRALKTPGILHTVQAARMVKVDEVLVVEWQTNYEARAMAGKIARIAVRAGVVAFSILNLVGI